jgi:recombination protein RecT
LPSNYSAENALKSAGLILQDLKVKGGERALDVCDRASIANSLLSMVVQGLNPDKKQCYFIPYSTTLTLQRSYFGNEALAKRLDPQIKQINADVVYKDDVFEYEKKRGITVITKHAQKIGNVKRENIIAAYATIIYEDDHEETTIMSYAEIMQSWKMSKMKPVDDSGKLDPNSTHGKFTEEMCKKTVTSKACKPIINSSDDSTLVVKFARQSDDEAAVAEVEEEVQENANKVPFEVGEVSEVQDVEFKDVDKETGEVSEPKQESKYPEPF